MKKQKNIYEVAVSYPYAEIFRIEAYSAKEAVELARSGILSPTHSMPIAKSYVQKIYSPPTAAKPRGAK